MVRLTAELVLTSPAFVNPLKERELDLRGNKIPKIENLGATEDQYDVLDFSDNDITRLENFPILSRLTTIIINNNRVQTVETDLHTKIPNLETLILTNNRIENLSDVDMFSGLKKLHTLSFLKNPVTRQKHYRLYVIHKIPSLRVLDFHKIKMKERQEAEALFGGESGKTLEAELSKKKTFIAGAAAATGLTDEQKQKIKELISKAESYEEVQRLDRILASGKLPKEVTSSSTTTILEDGIEDGVVGEGASRKGESSAGGNGSEQNGAKEEEQEENDETNNTQGGGEEPKQMDVS